MREAATWAASGLSVIAISLYLSVTLRNAAQPHPASWLVWAGTDTVMLVLQVADGVRVSVLVLIPQVAGVLAICGISWYRRYAKWRAARAAADAVSAAPGPGGRCEVLVSPADATLLAAAGCTLIWYVLKHDAPVAVLLAVAVELTGAAMTAFKVYREPSSEPLSSWLVLALSGAAATWAVVPRGTGPAADVAYAYPAALVLMGIAIPLVALLATGQSHAPRLRHGIGRPSSSPTCHRPARPVGAIVAPGPGNSARSQP